jgi:hypothetical protein
MKSAPLLLLGQNSVDQFADPQRVTADVERYFSTGLFMSFPPACSVREVRKNTGEPQ